MGAILLESNQDSHAWNGSKPPQNCSLYVTCMNQAADPWIHRVHSLKLTFSHLKIDAWKTTFLFGRPIFKGYVGFGEGMVILNDLPEKNRALFWLGVIHHP